MTSQLRKHMLFLALLVAGVFVRAIACFAYHPVLWFSDGLRYAAMGVYPYPDVLRPSGYPLLLLYPLHWAHSFMLVIIVQHLLGLVTGAVLYVVLLRRGIRRWAAALAAAPILLSAYQIQIEHFILSDPLFVFLLVVALAALLWNDLPGLAACVVAGVALGTAAIVRSEGLPLVAAFLLWLLTRRSPWRQNAVRALLVGVAFLAPVATYAVWFHQSYGHYNLTYSQGLFLASRAESFANCGSDDIPLADRWLCDTEPGHRPDWYVWTKGTPLHKAGRLRPATDKQGTSFAEHVFAAQPGTYVLTTWNDILQNFTAGQSWHPFAFPLRTPPSLRQVVAANPGNPIAPIFRYDPQPSTRLLQPWADIMQAYQRVVVIPPVVTAIVVLAGLAGVGVSRKERGGPGLLPWLMGVILLVFPAATSGFGARYELAAIAPLCMAAVLGLAEITGETVVARRLAHAG